jgi:hypothetical protein
MSIVPNQPNPIPSATTSAVIMPDNRTPAAARQLIEAIQAASSGLPTPTSVSTVKIGDFVLFEKLLQCRKLFMQLA